MVLGAVYCARLSIVVPDMDPLHPQSLGLYPALLAGLPVTVLLQPPGHLIKYMGSGPRGMSKLLLDLNFHPDQQ